MRAFTAIETTYEFAERTIVKDHSHEVRGLVCFHLDGTLLRRPTICEMLAMPVAALQEAGCEVAIASYTWRLGVEAVAEELGVRNFIASDFTADGRIEHVWAADKGRWLARLAEGLGLESQRVAAVGDSRGDIEMLKVAGVRVCVGQTALDGIPNSIHMPSADLRDVAEVILSGW